VRDTDLLEDFLFDYDDLIREFLTKIGHIFHHTLNEIFNHDGPFVAGTDPLNTGDTPIWQELSDITIQLKGSSKILEDTRQMINSVQWEISSSEIDGNQNTIKFGWLDNSGNRAYIAAIHEYGLTGTTYTAEDGSIMGGQAIGRTEEARKKIQAWYRGVLDMKVSGVIVIPERSMLRKTADVVVPIMEELLSNFIKDKFDSYN
jgi:hypothetical protein